MMQAARLLALLTSVASCLHAVSATPIPASDLAKRIVWSPPITVPRQGDVWVAGMRQIVKWSLEDMPDEVYDYPGRILLGYMTEGSDSLHLREEPLAEDFLLGAGKVIVDVPLDAGPRSNSIIVLMGDSGNASPEFTIITAPAVSVPNYVVAERDVDVDAEVERMAKRSEVWA